MKNQKEIPSGPTPSSTNATNNNVAPTSTPTHPAHGEKPAKFTGVEFKKWQQKMLIYLTTLGLHKFVKEDTPDIAIDDPDPQRRIAREAWDHGNFLCRNYILNGLDDALYGVYSNAELAKALWNTLERKYKIEDAGSKKFMVGKYLDYKMVDSKSVSSQVDEFQIILHGLDTEGMIMNEPFKMASIIEKLPPSWKDFKNYLKHHIVAFNFLQSS